MANQDAADLERIAEEMRASVEIKTRVHRLSTYPKCFLGTEAVQWMIDNGKATTVEDAVLMGNAMMGVGLVRHVLDSEDFANQAFFYQFVADGQHGEQAKKGDGTRFSWADQIRTQLFGHGANNPNADECLLPEVQSHSATSSSASMPAAQTHGGSVQGLGVTPLDEHNITLLDHVHPSAWINPPGDGVYNLVALGAGAGGLVATSAGAGVGARVALIEKHLMGGDCLNVGCVPSKALIKAADVAHTVRTAAEFGVNVQGEVQVDFAKVMERMRRLRAKIAPIDGAATKTKKGVDVFIGNGKFLDANHIEVVGDNGEKRVITFKKAVIATGAAPAVPDIPGLADVPFHTNLSLYNLEVLPPRMVVIGAGPIGMEMAQCFQRFGSQVTVLARSDIILPKEDRDAAEIVHKRMVEDGVQFRFGVKFVRISHTTKESAPFPEITISIQENGEAKDVVCEVLLVATGRRPNVEGIGLEAAGVKFSTKSGVEINDKMQTNVSHIYAVGDCCMSYQFTHVSGTQGAMAMRNALFFGNERVSAMLIPWVTFTQPEIAHVGLYEQDLIRAGIKYNTFVKHMDDVDRAILESETEGFVKLHIKQGSDKILGATIVATSAGEMISEISVAMQNKVGAAGLMPVIHPYPTQAEAIRGAAAQYMFTKLTPTVKAILRNLMNFSRS